MYSFEEIMIIGYVILCKIMYVDFGLVLKLNFEVMEVDLFFLFEIC